MHGDLLTSIDLDLSERLKNKEFRAAFFRRRVQDEIAMQIRHLRRVRKLRQVDLARLAEMLQSAISRIEQADYAGWSFSTLSRIASALDARLRISFEPIEDVLQRYADTRWIEDAILVPAGYETGNAPIAPPGSSVRYYSHPAALGVKVGAHSETIQALGRSPWATRRGKKYPVPNLPKNPSPSSEFVRTISASTT